MNPVSPFILILASAGSGKTYRLIHHLIGIIYREMLHEQPDRPHVVERILAATFTRAAAGEIIDRVLKRLAEAVLSPKSRKELCQAVGAGNLSDEECERMLRAVARRLHRLRICTLDSFLVRSAQSFAPELGLVHPWTIVNAPEDQALHLEAIDGLLRRAAADPREFVQVLDLLIMLDRGRFPLRVRDKLLEHFQATYDALLAGPPEAWEVFGPEPGTLLSAATLKDMAESLPTRLQGDMPLTQKRQPNTRWVTALNALCECIRNADWEGLAKGGLITAVMTDGKYCKIEMPDAFREALTPLVDHLGAAFLSELRNRNIATRELLRQFDEGYRRAKSRRNAYRFDDFTRLLDEARITTGLDEFYYRLDGRIDHILLDEFQDTSIPQWRLLQPLAEEILSGGLGSGDGDRSFFCVGDVKQTLYGWRNAEPRLIAEMIGRWPQLDRQSLVTSYRSSPVIIDSVNQIFGNLPANPALGFKDDSPHFAAAAKAWADWFEQHTTVHKTLPGFCRLITCADGEAVADRQQNALELAAQRVRDLAAAMPGAQIALLVRRKKFIAKAMLELSRYGIAASGEGGNPLIDNPAVCAALSALHLLDHPSDTAALYHVASSPLAAVLGLSAKSDRAEVLDITGQIRLQLVDRGIGAILDDWLLRIAPACSQRDFRRWRQLIELAHAYPYDGGELRPFLNYVHETPVEDVTEASVRVMTIHASKGRQFDVVVLPDLDEALVSGSATLLVSRENLLEPLTCITNAPRKEMLKFDQRLADMDAAWRQRQCVEELCALYVAMTRAKQGLEMIVHPQSSDNLPHSSAGVLRGALIGAGPVQPEITLWQHPQTMETTTDDPPADPSPAVDPLHVHILPAGPDSRNRPVVSPSTLEGDGMVSLRNRLSFADDVALDRGTVLHRWFQLIEWLDDSAPTDQQLHMATDDLGLSPRMVSRLIEEFRRACQRPKISALLRRDASIGRTPPDANLEVWRERAFAVSAQIQRGSHSTIAAIPQVIVQGQLDRFVLAKKNGLPIAGELIDFKTDRVSHSRDVLAERIAWYRPQLRAYRRALSHLTALPESAISAKLAFTEADEIIEID